MQVELSMNTPEERKEVFKRARRGEKAIVKYLREQCGLYVWTHAEIKALNLLLREKVDTPETSNLLKLFREWDTQEKHKPQMGRKESERRAAIRRAVYRDEEKAAAGETDEVDTVV